MTPDPHLTLPNKLRFWARERAHEVALRQKDFGIWRPCTWADYERQARHFGLGLVRLGLAEKGHAAIISENCEEWVFAQLGLGMVGAVTVGVYPTSPAPEIEYLLQSSDASIVICEDQEQLDKVLEIRARLPKLEGLVVIDPKGLRHYAVENLHTFEEVVLLGAAYEREQPGLIAERLGRQSEDDVALMIFTSGSTGRPKAAMISYGNINAMASGTDAIYCCTTADSMLSYLPLCHVAEQIYTVYLPLHTGAVVNFAESLRTRSARRFFWACRAFGKSCTPRSRSASGTRAATGNGCTRRPSPRWDRSRRPRASTGRSRSGLHLPSGGW